MSFTSAVAAEILDQCILGSSTLTPGTPYAALAVVAGSEMSGTGYARQSVTFPSPSAANPSVSAVVAEADFGTVAGDWSPLTIDESRIYSASSAGTLLMADPDTAITYASGNRAFIRAGMQAEVGANSVFSAAYSQSIIDWVLRAGSVPSRARYIGLANSGTELSGGNYARFDTDTLWAAATVADPSVSAFTAGETVFQASATFTGACDQIQFFAASTGGSALITVAVTSQTIASSDEVRVNPTVTFT